MENKLSGVGNQRHYTTHEIEPIDYIVANNMNFLEGNVIKYVTRYKLKNGIEDLRKAQQYLQWLVDEQEKSIEENRASIEKYIEAKKAIQVNEDVWAIQLKHESASIKNATGQNVNPHLAGIENSQE